MKSCYRESDEIMAIRANRYGKYPVQISLTRKEYDLLRKEAYKMDKTLNTYVKDAVLEFVQTKK